MKKNFFIVAFAVLAICLGIGWNRDHSRAEKDINELRAFAIKASTPERTPKSDECNEVFIKLKEWGMSSADAFTVTSHCPYK